MSTATMSAVLQSVLDDTKRPDMISILERRILRAARLWHRKDRWKRDIIETLYIFANSVTALVPNQPVATGANSLFLNNLASPQLSTNVQQIDTLLLPRFRNLWYLRKWVTLDQYGQAVIDPTTGLPGTVQNGDLFERSADAMFDGYGYDLRDVYYRSGTNITINSSTPLAQVYLGYYCDPILDFTNIDTTANITNGLVTWNNNTVSWIIDNYPDLIAAVVKAQIFNDIGKDEEKRGAQVEATEQALVLYGENIRLGER